MYIERTDVIHVPFADDPDLDQHRERCLTFDQGIVLCSFVESIKRIFLRSRQRFLQNRLGRMFGRRWNALARVEHLSKELSTCAVVFHGLVGLSHPIRFQVS